MSSAIELDWLRIRQGAHQVHQREGKLRSIQFQWSSEESAGFFEKLFSKKNELSELSGQKFSSDSEPILRMYICTQHTHKSKDCEEQRHLMRRRERTGGAGATGCGAGAFQLETQNFRRC